MKRSADHAPNLVALVTCLCLCASVVLAEPAVPADEITLEWTRVFVNIPDGPSFSLMVEPEETVMDLRRDIYELEGILCDLATTTAGDIQLGLDDKFLDYINASNTVTMDIPVNKQHECALNVRTLDGREFPITTKLGITVAEFKDDITQSTGIPQAQQRLLLRGKELKNDRRLADYNIFDRVTLDLGRPLADCHRVVSINVRTLSGARIAVEVDLADTVAGLQEKIWEKTGVPSGVQHLRANERLIAGEDHLCDLGLAAGSTVYMFLYSTRITSLDQVARLREPPVARPATVHRSPIFHEAEDSAGGAVQSDRRSLYRDARNWIVLSGRHPGWDPDLFDPVAHLAPNPDHELELERYRSIFEIDSHPDASEEYRLGSVISGSRIKLSSAVRPYRVAANLTSDKYARQRPGISLGGRFADESPERPIPLGADVNNWAPDAFTDSDVMRLFEVSERVRRALAGAAQTGEGILSVASQRQINREILSTYLVALAGYPPAVEYNQPRADEDCGICRDELTAEPAIKLACGHAFHTDCALPWAVRLNQEEKAPSCPLCRQRFLLAYKILGKAELATPGLQDNRDE